MSDLLRAPARDGGRVAPVELFFDLVFVFAVTQLSHHLLEHLTVTGALQTLLLLLAVWWAWVYTAWITSWFDPGRTPIRLMLLGIMLVSLLLSASVRGAFGGQALLFAIAYVVIQVGRTVFLLIVLGRSHELTPNFTRVLAWFLATAVLWVVGGVLGGTAQIVLWVLAVVLDYLGPMVGFHTPRLGRSRTTLWHIEGSHLAERCHLFMIVALGESILITGGTAAALPATVGNSAAFGIAFVSSAALWWLYFDHSAEVGSSALSAAADPGRLARSAYNYFHLPMIAGIILTAVGDELSIAHPGHHAGLAEAATIVGGPVLYLLGNGLFKWSITGRLHRSRVVAVIVLLVLGAVTPLLLVVVVAGLAAVVLISACVWDTRSIRRAA